MTIDKKGLKREYAETARPMGVFRIHNKVSDRSLIGSSTDLTAILNRSRSELRFGGHRNRELQRDFTQLGEEAFAFEVLDTLTPREESGYDPKEDLQALEALWLEKLSPFDERGYNSRPRKRD